MNLVAKLVAAGICILIIAVLGFGWHIKTVYSGFVASTDAGDPLFERSVLERYGDQILNELRAKNVRVAIVSRSGQPRDKLPDGVMFTHSAFFVQDGNDYAVYNLYHGEENRLKSSLVTDTPSDFLKLLREKDAGLIIPKPDTQDALYAHIHSPNYAAVHQVNYSLISNPFDLRWQNCNEFMLYTMGAMIWQTTDTTLIRDNLENTITPTELKASFTRRHFGPKIDERLIMADHDKQILTTTFQTLRDLLKAENRLEQSYVLQFKDP